MRRTWKSAVLLWLCSAVVFAAAEKLKPEEMVRRHLDAQFPAYADRARVVRGTCTLTSPSKGAGVLDGSFQISSSANDSKMVMNFPSDAYPGENFAASGPDVEIGFAQPRTSSRSALGVFLSTNRVIVGEGLLGGALNAKWPLLHVAAMQPSLSYDGMKKQGGRELHRLRYRAKKGQGALDVFLFFEPETNRHVASVYEASIAQAMGRVPETSSQQTETYFRLEETFSDFEQAGGLLLPRTWTLRYARSGDSTSEWKYAMHVQALDEPAAK